MQVLVVGGTGHIGTFEIPALVAAGHDVTVISRGHREPYLADDAWAAVHRIECDRLAEEQAGAFGERLGDPEVVIDHTCFTVQSARAMVEAMPVGAQLIHTGSIWAYGRNTIVPVTESSVKAPYGEYGVNKAAIEDYLLRQQTRVRATVIHPGHISGPGWVPINPAGNVELDVYAELITAGRVVLPERGMGLLQHVHADDVAALHLAAMQRPDAAATEAFNSVADESMTLRGYAEHVATAYGHELDATYLPWDAFVERVGAEAAAVTEDHIARSPHVSTAKAERLLGFRPRHSAWDTVAEAIAWLVDAGRLPRSGATVG